MPRAHRVLLLTILIAPLVVGSQLVSLMAQDDPRRAVIGTWEGTVTQRPDSAPARLEFFEQGDKLAFKWFWGRGGQAEGTVISFAPPLLQIEGRYTVHPSAAVVKSPVTMSFTVSGTQMQGTGLTAAVKRVFAVSLTKK